MRKGLVHINKVGEFLKRLSEVLHQWEYNKISWFYQLSELSELTSQQKLKDFFNKTIVTIQQGNLVLLTELKMQIGHCKEFKRLTFQALALRQSDCHNSITGFSNKLTFQEKLEFLLRFLPDIEGHICVIKL